MVHGIYVVDPFAGQFLVLVFNFFPFSGAFFSQTFNGHICNKIFVDIGNMLDGLLPDMALCQTLDIEEPPVRIESFFSSLPAKLINSTGAGIICRKCKVNACGRFDLLVAEISVAEKTQVLDPCVDVIFQTG